MKHKHVLRVLCVAAAASALVWAVTMAIGGRQPGPQQVRAAVGQKAAKVVIDDAMREVDASPPTQESNPIRIADSSPALDRVIALGTPALPELISQIENSSHSGLREYLLAICVKRIIKANVSGPPGTDYYWYTGKGFPAVWKTYLARVPETVSSIAKSNAPTEEKNARLVELGTPAIPFILDEVERGRGDLSPAAQTLMEGTVEMGGTSPKGPGTAEWAKQNKPRFTELRDLVSAAK